MALQLAQRRALIVCVVLAAVALVTFAQTSMAAPLLRLLGLKSDDPAFLELYFADVPGHPTDVDPGQRVRVSFILAGHGQTFAHVSWRLESQQGSAVELQGEGTVSVPENGSVRLDPTATIACDNFAADARTQVRVSTELPSQTILFWVTCSAAAP